MTVKCWRFGNLSVRDHFWFSEWLKDDRLMQNCWLLWGEELPAQTFSLADVRHRSCDTGVQCRHSNYIAKSYRILLAFINGLKSCSDSNSLYLSSGMSKQVLVSYDTCPFQTNPIYTLVSIVISNTCLMLNCRIVNFYVLVHQFMFSK
jgi:hypothetical protein